MEVTMNSAFLGVFVFSVGCLVSGMMFAGIDAAPADKVGLTVTIIQKWVGIGLLISAVPLFLAAPKGMAPGVAVWFGTLLAYFGILWIWLSETLSKGGDLKPIGIMLLFTSVICFAYVVMTANFVREFDKALAAVGGYKLFGNAGYTGNMFGDVFILMLMAGIACLSAFIGIRFQAKLLKYVGYMFVIIGLWGTYMSVRYVWEWSAGNLF